MARHMSFGSLLVLLLTTAARGQAGVAAATDGLTTVIYPVAELVVPIERGIKIEGIASTHGQLIEQIQKQVAPRTWEAAGGAGALQFSSQNLSLLVRQTPAVHAELRKFLGLMERTGNREVKIEVRFLTLSAAFEELAPPRWTGKDGARTAPLNDAQLFALMSRMQGDRRSSVMQLPAITCFDGQAVKVEAIDKLFFLTGVEFMKVQDQTFFTPRNEGVDLGVRARLLPVVSADGRHIHLKAELEWRWLHSAEVPLVPVQIPVPQLEGPAGKAAADPAIFRMHIQQPSFGELKQDVAAKMRDGQSIAVHMGKLQDSRAGSAPPVLAKVPYLSRLFRNRRQSLETSEFVVVLTPRLLDLEDADDRNASSAAAASK